jgi:hypothetical protein
MHGEHRLWESDISQWRDDLRAWQHELAQSQREIQQLERALQKHAQTLQQHASALRLEEQTAGNHEHEIVKYERGAEGDALFEMARAHSQEALRHAEHRAAHEQLKRQHHTMIARWNVLLKELRCAAEAASPPVKPGVAVPK